MPSPTINHRVAEALAAFLPFKMMDKERLNQLSGKVIIKYFSKGESIFNRHQQYVAFIKEGVLHVSNNQNNKVEIIDIASEGDLAGIWKLYPEIQEQYTTICHEEALVYFIPVEVLEDELMHNPKLALYFTTGFSSQKKAEQALETEQEAHQLQEQYFHLYRLSDIDHPKGTDLITVTPNLPINLVAEIMSEKGVSSVIIVDDANLPFGIVTDRDLRAKVATGNTPITRPVSEIMSSPVKTIGGNSTLAEVQIAMVQNNIHHLCVTDDGTYTTPVRGIVTDTNLLLQQANNPVVIVSRVKKAKNIEELVALRHKADHLLKSYLQNEVSIPYSAAMIREINDALVRKCIRMVAAEMDIQLENTFCWVSIGSAGRGEQLIRTDQDNALIFNSPEDSEQFRALANRVNDNLKELGFDYCPANMMARNASWNQTLEKWEETFNGWIAVPTPEKIMHSTIFFDMRAIYGSNKLVNRLFEHIKNEISRNDLFLHYLAQNALSNPPPLSLFRNFVVEKEGNHIDSFDIKARVIMPLTDAARVLIFEKGRFTDVNTSARYHYLAEQELKSKALFRAAADAFEWLLRIRAISAFRNGDSGRYVPLEQLNKWQRKNLKQTFKLVTELQDIIETRFQLNYLRR